MMPNSLGKILLTILICTAAAFAETQVVLTLSKNPLYLNEMTKATLTLQYKQADAIDHIDFEGFDGGDFLVKELEHIKPVENDGILTDTYTFLLEPKAEGNYTLPPQMIRVTSPAIREHKMWEKHYTEAQPLTVLPLPEGLPVQGNYTIETQLDKTEVEANKPLNFTIRIHGEGNLQDIGKFDLGLKEQLVYTDAPRVAATFQGESYQGTFTQQFSILSDRGFTIPSIRFTYFDTQSHKVKTISTQPLYIAVKSKPGMHRDYYGLKYAFGLIGIVLGLALTPLLNYLKGRVFQKEISVADKIRKAKDDKALYAILLAFSQNSELGETMKQLEANIYRQSRNSISKKKIIKILRSKP